MECELDWAIAVGMKGSCRISYTWIPPVKTQLGPLTWVAFMATACMIHTNHISGSAVWTKRSRYVMSCKWEGRGSVVWYGYKHLTLPTDAWLIEFLLFSLLLDLFGCIYVGECVDGARSRVRACVAGVAWGKNDGCVFRLCRMPALKHNPVTFKPACVWLCALERCPHASRCHQKPASN